MYNVALVISDELGSDHAQPFREPLSHADQSTLIHSLDRSSTSEAKYFSRKEGNPSLPPMEVDPSMELIILHQ